ncbi:STAGA complex 65 subunit gamma-like [Ostrea edulis]|uniref:STAGA complex 65 subunit gamma-like n=1 Tax=Ostrea edulis TaxID=37623 RepID=UPI0024AEF51E|nr:STAGA complex 65 subunit gamma-like [Ostrea edulis]XP_056010204.1 STAGA complex 65 subunit gamma-like [Ostrea edulis]XP_056010205.1 STAGA complex 65 subunit gamma-like [Ostrea edulis]
MSSQTYWGELPQLTDMDRGIAALDREQMTKLRSIEVEGPRLHQPSSRHQPPSKDPLPSEKFEMDPVVVHTIKLMQHAKKLRSLISSIQHQQDGMDVDLSFPPAPPIPEYAGPPIRSSMMGPVPFLPKDSESDFVRGVGEIPPAVDEEACRKLLRKSTAALCAHLGFDTCNESVLETLTDVAHEYFQDFCTRLRNAADNKLLHGYSGFPDIAEQVYHEIGIGSVTNVRDFYQSRVINHHAAMQQTCIQLMTEYEKLNQPIMTKQMDTVPVIRIKEESSSEIQFPVLDENDELNDAEQLLQLEGLGGFEITVEHESASGLTTEVESKWTKESIKTEPVDTPVTNTRVSTLDDYDDPSSIKVRTPRTPAQMSEGGDISNPGSVAASDIMSPPSISRPSKPKKRKK